MLLTRLQEGTWWLLNLLAVAAVAEWLPCAHCADLRWCSGLFGDIWLRLLLAATLLLGTRALSWFFS